MALTENAATFVSNPNVQATNYSQRWHSSPVGVRSHLDLHLADVDNPPGGDSSGRPASMHSSLAVVINIQASAPRRTALTTSSIRLRLAQGNCVASQFAMTPPLPVTNDTAIWIDNTMVASV
jgi:hypothetical protein